MLKLMMLTHDPVIAKAADDAGVDRIFYDLEYINKRERQSGRNTVISEYDPDGILGVKNVLTNSKLVVRVNPLYFNSRSEINKVLSYNPDYVMLPMALDAYDVKKFIELVDKKAKTIVMIETTQALARIDDILDVDGIDEIFVGLNDLHIGLGLNFMFETIAYGILDFVASRCNEKGIVFGFGGVARIGQGELPAEYIIGEHYRVGSQTVILSRVFKGTRDSGEKAFFDFDLKEELSKIRQREAECAAWGKKDFENNHDHVKKCVKRILNNNEK